ncbi:MAG: hypothetical protein ACXADY_10280 [Candidatus Hodarchaeales archaeon]
MKENKVSLQIIIILLLVGLTSRVLGKNTVQESINEPDFGLIDSSLTPVQQGVYEFTATVQNTGDPATAGNVPISWENIIYDLALDDGNGTLVESDVGSDLNGDGDTLDSYDVTWFQNDTRNWDAIINDGVQDIHAYSFWEGPPENRKELRTYYINEEPKLFKLGSETHSLIFADNDYACFGLGDAHILNHPNTNFEIVFEQEGLDSSVSATDFEINGSPVEVNYTWEQLYYPYWEEVTLNQKVYLVPNEEFEIDQDEEVIFSCTITTIESVTCDVYLIMNWSPDGNIRSQWILFFQEDVEFEAITSTTAETEPSDSIGTPGFSFMFTLMIVLPVLIYIRKRKNT